jgi:hypothetical protein
MEEYTHNVTGSYIFNEQIISLSGKAKVDERTGNLEVLLTELYDNKTYTLTGDIINTEDFTIIDMMENKDSDGPLIWYNVANPSQSSFDGRYDGERSDNIYLTKPKGEELEKKSFKEIVNDTLKEGILENGRPTILIFQKIRK